MQLSNSDPLNECKSPLSVFCLSVPICTVLLYLYHFQADESSARVSQLNKTVEELNGKLKSEEAKRRELEVKLALQENAAHVDKAISTEEKPKVCPLMPSNNFLITSEFVISSLFYINFDQKIIVIKKLKENDDSNISV